MPGEPPDPSAEEAIRYQKDADARPPEWRLSKAARKKATKKKSHRKREH
jgi:hypothetical protein